MWPSASSASSRKALPAEGRPCSALESAATLEGVPPSPAMKRFADSLARQKGIKPPPGYQKSISICRKFLDEHAPKKAGDEKLESLAQIGESGADFVSPRRSRRRKASSSPRRPRPAPLPCLHGLTRTEAGAWEARSQDRLQAAGINGPKSKAPTKRSRKRKADAIAAPPTPDQQNPGTDTPLRIPYGNKDVALKLGARYRLGGWYAPPGVDLSAFGERGWL